MQSTLHTQAHRESARCNRPLLSQSPSPPVSAYLRPVAFVDAPVASFEQQSVQLIQALHLFR